MPATNRNRNLFSCRGHGPLLQVNWVAMPSFGKEIDNQRSKSY